MELPELHVGPPVKLPRLLVGLLVVAHKLVQAPVVESVAQVVAPQHSVALAVEGHQILHKKVQPQSLHGAPSSLPAHCHP